MRSFCTRRPGLGERSTRALGLAGGAAEAVEAAEVAAVERAAEVATEAAAETRRVPALPWEAMRNYPA